MGYKTTSKSGERCRIAMMAQEPAEVPDNWKDAVPPYAHAGDKVLRLGMITATHPKEQLNFTVPGRWIESQSMNTKRGPPT
jgi:hypothetical protein